MSPTDRKDDLFKLAELYGVQPSYTDLEGRVRTAGSEAVIRVLKALGAPVESEKDASEAIRECERRIGGNCVEPVIISSDGGPVEIRLRIPEHPADDGRECRIEISAMDGGTVRRFRFSLGQAPTEQRERMGDDLFAIKRVILKSGLPFGYYNLKVEFGDTTADSLIVSAPSSLSASLEKERSWGVFLPLYSLHSRRSWGIGDFSDLSDLVEWTGSKGGSTVGILPILSSFLSHDSAPEQPFDYSPYAPASRLFWNEIFVDVEAVPDLADCPSARKILESREFQSELSRLRQAEYVDYKGVYSLKRRVLLELSRCLRRADSRRGAEFRSYLENHPDVADYARFRAVGDREGKPWQMWRRPLRDGTISEGDYDSEIADFYAYGQWIAEEQLTSVKDRSETAGVGLYLDMPLGVHSSSYDIYRERECFVLDVSAGAPPDPLAVEGQDWRFPPLNHFQLRRHRYRYFIAALRHHLEYARVLRLDHAAGFHRLYLVPHGMDAGDGVYVRYPADEMYAILCLEAHRSGSVVVGEDLGTVPERMREELKRRSLHRMYVVPFEIGADSGDAVSPIPEMSLAVLNTHDMATFTGFLEGRDIRDRKELGIYNSEEADREQHRRAVQRSMWVDQLRERGFLAGDATPERLLSASLRYLADSRARMMMVNLEDLWLETEPQNVPGTSDSHANWRRKTRFALEEIFKDDRVTNLLGEIDRLRTGTAVRGSSADEGVTVESGTPVRRSLLSDNDLYLFNEGSHLQLYNHLGAHRMTVDGVDGTYFAVWAPDAEQVSVIGDFNGWDRGRAGKTRSALSPRSNSGIWEGFVPGVLAGSLYKYHIVSRYTGYQVEKADPFGFKHEAPPRTASIVTDLEYSWGDQDWMEARRGRNGLNSPISIYEVHLGSWRRILEEGNRSLTYREIAPLLVDYVKKLGFTHVELLPITEHPFYGSWGYQTTGYFAPTSRYGTPQDFMHLIDSLHQAGIGVILDWVPSHFPSDEHGLAFFDGTHLYEHSDPQKGLHPDWDSYIFNYGRKEVQSFLISSALFWLSEYHMDGLRIDAVASMLYLDYSRVEGEWIPNRYGGRENLEAISFLRRLNREIYQRFPDVQTFAEESTSWPMVSRPVNMGGLGFGLKWDMGWMHDTLKYMRNDPMYRKYHHVELTFRMLYAFHENFTLPLSHDEVVHGKSSLLGKMPGDDWQKFANLRLMYSYMYSQPGKKLLFMGAEFAQWREWDHEASLEWHLTQYERHAGMQKLVEDLNRLYRTQPALHELDTEPAGFEWIDGSDSVQSCLSYLRKDRSGDMILIALNFTPVVRHGYRIGVPKQGIWRELLSSDAVEYGGSGVCNPDARETEYEPVHGRDYSINVTLPPLAATFLKLEKNE